MIEPHKYEGYLNRQGCVKCPFPMEHSVHSVEQTSGPKRTIVGVAAGGAEQPTELTVEEDSSSAVGITVGESILPTTPEQTRAVLSRLLRTLAVGSAEHEAVRLAIRYIGARDLPPIA